LIRDEQAKNPNKLMVWTKKQRRSVRMKKERNKTPLMVTCGGQVTGGVLW